MRRPRRVPIHPRTDEATLSSALAYESTLIATPPMTIPPTSHYVPSYSGPYTNPFIFKKAPYIPSHFFAFTFMTSFVFGPLSPMYNAPMPSTFFTVTYEPSMFRASTESLIVMPSMYGTQHSYTHSSFVMQTPLGSLFYQGGSSFQPHFPRMEDAQWQPRMHELQSTEDEEDDL